MPSTSTVEVKSALTKCGIFDKYPEMKGQINELSYYVLSGYRGLNLSTDMKTFINKIALYNNAKAGMIPSGSGYVQLPIDQYLEELSKNSSLYKFKIYHKYNINDFRSSGIVSEFCGKPIDHIIKSFECFQIQHIIPMHLQKNVPLINMVHHIIDVNLVIMLGKIFVPLDLGMKYNCVYEIMYPDFYYTVDEFVETFFKKATSVPYQNNEQKLMDDLVGRITREVEMDEMEISIGPDQQKFITEFYQMRKQINDLLVSKTSELEEFIKKIPEFDATYGKFIVANKSPKIIIRNIMDCYSPVMNYIIDESKPKNTKPGIDLVMPSKQILNRMLVIEI